MTTCVDTSQLPLVQICKDYRLKSTPTKWSTPPRTHCIISSAGWWSRQAVFALEPRHIVLSCCCHRDVPWSDAYILGWKNMSQCNIASEKYSHGHSVRLVEYYVCNPVDFECVQRCCSADFGCIWGFLIRQPILKSDIKYYTCPAPTTNHSTLTVTSFNYPPHSDTQFEIQQVVLCSTLSSYQLIGWWVFILTTNSMYTQ